jgi:hypothetical protein
VIITRASRSRGFSQLPNQMLEDGGLSFKARGVLAYLLSRPEGWNVDSVRLARSVHAHKDGRDSILSAMTELELLGYLVRVRAQDAAGQWSTKAFVYDEPVEAALRSTPRKKSVHSPVDNTVDGLGTTERPKSEKPNSDNPTPLTTLKNHRDPATQGDHRGAAGAPVDNSGSALGRPSGLGKAALASGSPSAAAAGAAGGRAARSDAAFELALSPADAAALLEAGPLGPGLSLYALRAHLRITYLEPALDFVDVLDVLRLVRDLRGPVSSTALTVADVIALAVRAEWRPRHRPSSSGGPGADASGADPLPAPPA